MPVSLSLPQTNWIIQGRDVILIALGMGCAILLALGSAIYGYRTSQRERRVIAFVAQVDSLHRDWVSRGCQPKSAY